MEGCDLIGCESVNWVCPRLGIKGVRCSHSGVGGVRRGEGGGRGCCDIRTRHMVAVKQVRA